MFDILELGGSSADTVQLSLPEKAPISATGKPKAFQLAPLNAQHPDADKNWWNGWASMLVAALLVPPVVDPRRLADLLHDPRRIRFCCDTNALAGGVASWLLLLFGERADLVTSAVVDRELAAWPDRLKSDFWQAKSAEGWCKRTQYRLARRLIEAPPRGVVVDRLSPEQGALMLAKRRDEEDVGKSPDADVLLVELARALVRDQPRNARVVFLTGDRNNARTATGVLGAENVLFAAADSNRAKAWRSKTVARGVWRPEGPLGAVLVPTVGSLIWDLLAACDRLRIEQATSRWEVHGCSSVPHGVPSDWADPWIEIHERPSSSAQPTVAVAPADATTRSPATDVASPVEGMTSQVRAASMELVSAEEPELTQEAPPAEPYITASPKIREPEVPTSHRTQEVHRLVDNDWLLPPVKAEAPLDVPSSWRPQPRMVFPLLARALGGPELPPDVRPSQTMEEALRLLAALGATDAVGGPGPRAEAFRTAWLDKDHDWFHAEMRRLPGYAATLERVRADGSTKLTARQETQVSMARALGQAARLERVGGGLIVGDAPLRAAELSAALERWLPSVGVTRSTEELCQLAAAELHLTPARLERAMERLWASGSGVLFEPATGGTVVPGFAEQIISLGQIEAAFHPVAPGDLSFGRSGPVRFVTRTG